MDIRGNNKMSRKEFEDISIAKWKVAAKSAANRVYRVFKNSSEFEVVEAENASEAVQKSGISNVYMIKYGAMDDTYMYQSNMLTKDEPVAAQ